MRFQMTNYVCKINKDAVSNDKLPQVASFITSRERIITMDHLHYESNVYLKKRTGNVKIKTKHSMKRLYTLKPTFLLLKL